jgi:menaquinone-dependent protoporphyrinogen oxidase
MKVLVTAASRHGSTAEMAARIAQSLESAGLEVEVTGPDEVRSLTGYDAVVLGSAIYMGHWLEPAKTFAHRFESELTTKPVWAFSSGPLGDPPKPEGTAPEIVAILATLNAREHQVFGGEIDRAGLGFTEQVITRAVRAPEGDFRDWASIDAFAQRIAATLIEELGWRHDGAAERDEMLREFWRREMEATEPVG